MDLFIDTSQVTVTDGDNTFFIKRRMDFGTLSDVEDTMTMIGMKNGQVGDIRFTLGAQKLALAMHNIVGWKGPGFVGMPCTPENIRKLNPKHPLLIKAQARITELNKEEEPVDPNDSTTTGETSTATNGHLPAVVSMST